MSFYWKFKVYQVSEASPEQLAQRQKKTNKQGNGSLNFPMTLRQYHTGRLTLDEGYKIKTQRKSGFEHIEHVHEVEQLIDMIYQRGL